MECGEKSVGVLVGFIYSCKAARSVVGTWHRVCSHAGLADCIRHGGSTVVAVKRRSLGERLAGVLHTGYSGSGDNGWRLACGNGHQVGERQGKLFRHSRLV